MTTLKQLATYIDELREQLNHMIVEKYGLGDIVECVLHKIGITPERYVFIKWLFMPWRNIEDIDCGCERRKEILNKIGRFVGFK